MVVTAKGLMAAQPITGAAFRQILCIESGWRGTPPEIIAKLNAEINRAIARPEMQVAWYRQGATPMKMSPSEFDAYLRKDIEKWAQVANISGAAAQ